MHSPGIHTQAPEARRLRARLVRPGPTPRPSCSTFTVPCTPSQPPPTTTSSHQPYYPSPRYHPAASTLPIEPLNEACSYLRCPSQDNATTCSPPELPSVVRAETHDVRQEHAALLNLTKTSRSLHAAAQPFLYYRLRTAKEGDVYLLVRTLAERPDLRSRIFDVEITYGGDVQAASWRGSCSFSTAVSKAVESRFRGRGWMCF